MKNPVKLFTRKVRADIALRYFPACNTHLDIGCGSEKYFLRRSPAKIKIGLDRLLGDNILDTVPFDKADCITMLAVIEHMEQPRKIIEECYRIFSRRGVLIMTTPKKKAESIIRFYAGKSRSSIEEEHKQYFDLYSMKELVRDLFEITTYKTFEFGFNQLFVCKKVR